MKMFYEKVLWECWHTLWDVVQMFKYKTIQIFVIFLTMTGCDTLSPRDADASKKREKYYLDITVWKIKSNFP